MPFAIALPAGTVAVAVLRLVERRRSEAGNRSARPAPWWLVVVVVALTTSAAAAAYEIYLVGHGGAVSVWSGVG